MPKDFRGRVEGVARGAFTAEDRVRDDPDPAMLRVRSCPGPFGQKGPCLCFENKELGNRISKERWSAELSWISGLSILTEFVQTPLVGVGRA